MVTRSPTFHLALVKAELLCGLVTILKVPFWNAMLLRNGGVLDVPLSLTDVRHLMLTHTEVPSKQAKNETPKVSRCAWMNHMWTYQTDRQMLPYTLRTKRTITLKVKPTIFHSQALMLPFLVLN